MRAKYIVDTKILTLRQKLAYIAWSLIAAQVLTKESNRDLCQIDVLYAGFEILNRGGKATPNSLPIKYMTDEELQASQLHSHPEAPSLVDVNGKTVDTQNFSSKHGDGFAAYGIDPSGKLYIHEHISGSNNKNKFFEFYHSSFFSAKPGYCFGMIKIAAGKITYIDNRSGHYKPNREHLVNAVDLLKPYFAENARVYCQSSDVPYTNSDVDTNLGLLFFEEEDDSDSVDRFLAMTKR